MFTFRVMPVMMSAPEGPVVVVIDHETGPGVGSTAADPPPPPMWD